MKIARYFEKATVCIIGTALIILYALGFMVSLHYGHWPEYSNPESWSTWPLNNAKILFNVLFIFFFISPVVIVLGIISTTTKFVIAKFNGQKIPNLIVSIVSIVLYLLIVIDPMGVINWFMD